MERVSLNRELCFKRLLDNPNDLEKVFKEFGSSSCDLDSFGQPNVIASRFDEDPMSWWASYGSYKPLLQGLAFRLLSQSASSCCECNWSTYGATTESLVYIHNNVRLVSRKERECMEGPSKYWDIGMINFVYLHSFNFYAIYLYVLTHFHLFCRGR